MLSRRALDDLAVFFGSGSLGGISVAEYPSDVIEVLGDCFEVVDVGEVKFEDMVDGGFLVLGIERGSMMPVGSESGASPKTWLRDGIVLGFRDIIL